MDDNIRKSLKSVPEYMPFYDNYDYHKLLNFILNEDANKLNHSIQTAKSTKYFNEYYRKLQGIINTSLEKLDYDSWAIIQAHLAMANREYYLLNKQLRKQNSNLLTLSEMSKFQIKSPIDGLDDMNVVASMEMTTNILNIIINRFKNKSLKYSDKLIEKGVDCGYVKGIYVAANILYVLKDSYDTALWENGYIKILDEYNFHIKYEDIELCKARYIGNIRTQNNLIGSIRAMELLTSNKKY